MLLTERALGDFGSEKTRVIPRKEDGWVSKCRVALCRLVVVCRQYPFGYLLSQTALSSCSLECRSSAGSVTLIKTLSSELLYTATKV